MTRWWGWVNQHINELLFWSVIATLLLTAFGCALIHPAIEDTTQFEFEYCKAGVGGDYRVLVPADKDELPMLALFSVGGPYGKDHVLCIISGDHAILDLGKGKGL